MSVADQARAWIGRQRHATDLVTARLADEFRVTLGAMHAQVPESPGLQWCLAPDIYPKDELGRDGHPRTGLVVPDLGLPRRMWAGGEVEWCGALRPGDAVSVETTVRDVAYKEGRSGKLGFLTLDIRYLVANDLRVAERRDIVYREDPAPDAPKPALPEAAAWPEAAGREVLPDPTLLFRYSAITFNGHRIHYDHPYATTVEGYAGLVVHGPIQAIWMQHLATDLLGRIPSRFSYRGVSPLTVGNTVRVEARPGAEGLELRVRDIGRNVVTMIATAQG
ncbi:FAS1-like dehydratase domain-containing protein [Seohaeicola zhoushanensis]|uniref:FAS1-like dehydratase domain-containing protein n=1 Tax=Seohaeicola zhoushanensis TaxID=1569283 RepID=A0A8J3GWY5_9RHOB|nr:MaoC family dehydratase N-terminal domain-containing protein [Seohaeicola zhoushanensis]GHF46444.1 hypothetical protein GCM10017056_17680 [Seohaeicola zhoushanensis]